MKTTFLVTILFAMGGLGIQAQTSTGSANTSPTDQTGVPAPTPYRVVDRSANRKVWQRETYEKSPDGKIFTQEHQYTELASGLNFWSKDQNQWLDSNEQIDVLPDGSAAATNGEHQAYFPADIYEGTILVVGPDGQQFKSQPAALAYDDGTSTVLIGVLTNSVGQLVGTNQVIYSKAFSGVDADILFTYKRGSFEQFIVLKSQPPTPESLGLNPATAKLQVLTEFFDNPAPIQNTSAVSTQDGLRDTTLTFGKMRMIHGKAFSMGTASREAHGQNIPVYKSWEPLQGRDFLIETVPYSRIKPQLDHLSASVVPRHNSYAVAEKLLKVSRTQSLPPAHLFSKNSQSMKLAKTDLSTEAGVVLDYDEIDSDQDFFTFQGDTTYYVSGECNFDDTTTIEGGAIIKLDNNGEIDIGENIGGYPGAIVCDTGPYRPAVFTSVNDNSVGESIGSGSPAYTDVNTFLSIGSSYGITLHDLRFCYSSQTAINLEPDFSPNTLGVMNCQFIATDQAVTGVYCSINLYNVLIDPQNISADPAIGISVGYSLDVENVTYYNSASAFLGIVDGFPVYMANCLIVGNLGANDSMTTNNIAVLSSSTGVFQTVGAGSAYLADNSPYHGAGATNVIVPSLLAELQQKTTYPPFVYDDGTVFTANTALNPQAQRDNNSNLDLGYHYDPIDYVVADAKVSNNVTFTLAAGTVLGWYHGVDSGPGLSLVDGSTFNTAGTATAPCWITHALLVQEGNGAWANANYYPGVVLDGNGLGVQPQVNSGFTKWAGMDTTASLFQDVWAYGSANFADCEFYSGAINSYRPSMYFTNCLFSRVSTCFYDQENAASFTFQNCTFYNGGLLATRTSGQSFSFWRVQDTTFDGTALQWNDNYGGGTNNTYFNYNAYNTNNLSWQTYAGFSPHYGTLEVVGPNSIDVTNYNWQTSWFGDFYLPTNSPLIEAGSATANLLGLYHFTTQTNQTIEGNSIVDIGYHYVATDTNGVPLDTNGDGIPDYIEDANGNGLDDSGEIGWNIVGDLGLTVIITEPRNGSTVP